ncbi:MAG: hypothetical protein Q9219_004957 [cf. Caloplaca sp. 3 TL-2023]
MAAQCSPPTYFWELFEIDYPKHCMEVFKMYEGLAWSDLVLDIAVLSLPLPIVARLRMPWRTKIKVIDVLMLGSVVLGSGIARVVSFMQVVDYTENTTAAFYKDSTYLTGGPLFWIFAENSIAIIGACLPTLAPLWSSSSDKSSVSKQSSVKHLWNRSSRSAYDDLERSPGVTKGGDDASDHRLVALGPLTSIVADDFGMKDRPRDGIEVRTTLSNDYTR